MLALLLGAHAHAFTLRSTEEGELLRWESFPVDYTWVAQDGDPDDAVAAVDAAFQAWEGTAGELSFDPAVSTDDPPVYRTLDASNQVWILPDWPFDDDVLASTDSWSTADGELIGFDIRVNGTKPWSTDGDPDAYDLQAALTHEVGHALGLDHSDVGDAVMYAEQLTGETFRRELDADDLAGIRALYGEPGEVSCASAPAAPPLLGGLVALGLVRRRVIKAAAPR